jgi:hypothetical protein
LGRIPQLRSMDQSNLPIAQEPVDLIGYEPGNFEDAE